MIEHAFSDREKKWIAKETLKALDMLLTEKIYSNDDVISHILSIVKPFADRGELHRQQLVHLEVKTKEVLIEAHEFYRHKRPTQLVKCKGLEEKLLIKIKWLEKNGYPTMGYVEPQNNELTQSSIF